MKVVSIVIRTGNSAFGEDAFSEAVEMARILERLSRDVALTKFEIRPGVSRSLLDANGNTVGSFSVRA